MTAPSDPTPERDALARLSVLEWAHERYDNTVRIMAMKVSEEDRASWLEDSAYWLAIIRQLTAVPHLLSELEAACGYLTNAAIDLETGAPKRTALATINGGLARARAAIAKADVAL